MTNEEELAKIIFFSREIETILKDKFKAKGKGLHTYIDSIENRLDFQLLKDLRYIATIRNKSMHESSFKVDDFSRYKRVAENLIYRLNRLDIEQIDDSNKKINFISIIFILLLIAGVIFYQAKEDSFSQDKDMSLERRSYNTNYIDNQSNKLEYEKPIKAKEEEIKSSNINRIIISDKKDINSDEMVAIKECLAFNNMKHTKNRNNISLKKGYKYKIIKHQKNQVRVFIDYISNKDIPYRWVDANCFE